MPLYRIQCEPLFSHRSWEKSPRVLLQSDADAEELLPTAARSAADACELRNLQSWRAGRIPESFDGALIWLSGEVPFSGSPAMLRHTFRVPSRRTFLPVHRPCLPQMPFLALEPRSATRGPHADIQNLAIRIASPAAASSLALEAIRAIDESWAKLSGALLSELAMPGGGMETLLALWQSRAHGHEIYAALAVRNLFVALLRLQQTTAAEKLLEQGRARFLGYAELSYLGALWHLRENRPAQALACVEKARQSDRAWVGTGGESTYRADWLLGILARRAGNQRVAFEHLRRAISAKPLFSPAVEEFIALRLPRRIVEANQSDLCLAPVENPQLLAPIFDFFLRHRVYPAAEQLLAGARLDEQTRCELDDRLQKARMPAQSSAHGSVRSSPDDSAQGSAQHRFLPQCPDTESATAGIVMSGPIFEHTSLARINREIAASLLDHGAVLSLESTTLAELPANSFAEGTRLEAALLQTVRDVGLTIRHQWPPDFRRPAEGKLAVILPWEFGSVPRAWVAEIEDNVDELWVPSAFVRNVMQRSGVVRSSIEILPNGFDPGIFRPDGAASRPPGCRDCAFLFVGGAIRRKGLDLLLAAYEAAFDPGEDVTLVVYVSGANASYRHNTLAQQLKTFSADARKPHLQILTEFLDDNMLAQLYRGCNALALPYRGEGFGMPLIEAMACGTPVIATAAGPALEFCEQRYAYLIPSRETLVPDEPPPLGPMAGNFTWFEPDFEAFVQALRQVYEKCAETAARGKAAAQAVHRTYTWKQMMALYQRRIRKLLQAPSAQATRDHSDTRSDLTTVRR